MRILAIDPGQRHIGVALSDPSGKVALPLTVLYHKSKYADAAEIVRLAIENNVGLIVIGQALDTNNLPTLQSRRSVNLSRAIQSLTSIPVILWEEFESTKVINHLHGSSAKRRKNITDHLSAVLILQSFIESQEASIYE